MTVRLLEQHEISEGQLRRIACNGQGILLTRVKGQVYALDDLCTHEDVSLSLGALCEHRLRCPLHGSEFDVRTGKVYCEPADRDLRCHPVHVDEQGWICIEPV